MTWETTDWAYVEKEWSAFNRLGRVLCRGCNDDHDTMPSRNVGEDTCSSKLSTSPGACGTVVHVYYVTAPGHIDEEANCPPVKVSPVTGEDRGTDESSFTATEAGEKNSKRTESSDKVNMEIHGIFELIMTLSIAEKGFPTATIGYDPYDSKSSSE